MSRISWVSSAEGTLLFDRCAATISVTNGSNSVGFATSLILLSNHWRGGNSARIIRMEALRARAILEYLLRILRLRFLPDLRPWVAPDSNVPGQDQGSGFAARSAIIILPSADLGEAGTQIKGARRQIVCRHFEKKPLRAAQCGLGRSRGQ